MSDVCTSYLYWNPEHNLKLNVIICAEQIQGIVRCASQIALYYLELQAHLRENSERDQFPMHKVMPP